MKKIIYILALVLFIAACSNAQTVNRLLGQCPTPNQRSLSTLAIQRDGNINAIPCPTKEFQINGNPVPSSPSGTAGFIPVFLTTSTLGNSFIEQDTTGQIIRIFPLGGWNITNDLATETFAINGASTGFSVGELTGLVLTGVSRFSGNARFTYTAATPTDNAFEIRNASNIITTGFNAVNTTTLAIGNGAGNLTLTAIDSVYVGANAGLAVTSGNWNTLIGKDAGKSLTTGTSNTAVGRLALSSATFNGSRNVAIGQVTGQSITTGTDNTFVGSGAADGFTTGTNNTVIGGNAGAGSTTGSGNVLIGRLAGAIKGAISNQLHIDNQLRATPLIGGDFTAFNVQLNGDVWLSKTVTAGGTTGAQTINKTTGTVNFAGGASSLIVTNSLSTVNSIIMSTARTNDATCSVKNVVADAGSFTITMTAACTDATSVGFLLTN